MVDKDLGVDYRNSGKYKAMEEYYEGDFKIRNSIDVHVMFWQAICMVLMIILNEYIRYLDSCGKLTYRYTSTIPMFFIFLCLMVVLMALIKNLLKGLLHLSYMYSAEDFFHYNCLADKPIRKLRVIDDKNVKIIYWMDGLRFARLNEYRVEGGKGKVYVVDTKKKILQVGQ